MQDRGFALNDYNVQWTLVQQPQRGARIPQWNIVANAYIRSRLTNWS